MSSIIQSLQTSHLLWHANHLALDPDNTVASGFDQLDSKLNGGWPDKGIVELQFSHIGIGEVRLLLPALRRLNQFEGQHEDQEKGHKQQAQQNQQQNQQELLYVWIAPPGRLNGQVLAEAGLPLSNTLIAADVSSKEAFWLAEKCLRSGCCAAVILWCDELEPTQAKRLQLAAKEGNSLGFIIRPPSEVEQSLPVSVRMTVVAHLQGLQVNISKRLGGYPVMPFLVDMNPQWPELSESAPMAQVVSLNNSASAL